MLWKAGEHGFPNSRPTCCVKTLVELSGRLGASIPRARFMRYISDNWTGAVETGVKAPRGSAYADARGARDEACARRWPRSLIEAGFETQFLSLLDMEYAFHTPVPKPE